MVLAAGSGRRFGGPKQLALLDGVPLVGHVVAALLAADLPVLVVVGPFADAVAAAAGDAATASGQPDRVRVVVNEDHRRGIGTSLGVAAATAGPRPLVVALADQPGLRVTDVTAVVAALAAGAEAARVVHPQGPGHPVGFGSTAHGALVALTDLSPDDVPPDDLPPDAARTVDPDRPPRSGRDVLADLAVTDLVVDHARPPDVDTPDDLAAIVAARSPEAPS